MVRADSHTVPRVVCYSGSLCSPLFISPTRLSLSPALLPRSLGYEVRPVLLRSFNPGSSLPVWALSAFARHYLRNRFLFLFLRLLRCFTSAGFAFLILSFQIRPARLLRARLPHSDTPGSSLTCSSPRLFAACCVLLRLLAPRHSPQALRFFSRSFARSPALAMAPASRSQSFCAVPSGSLLSFFFFGNCFLPLSWLVLHGSRREALFATRMSIFPSLLLQLPLRLPPSLVGLTGLEPVTPRLSSVCSNQLSYRPIASFPRRPLAWWRHGGSNPGLPACKAGALAN